MLAEVTRHLDEILGGVFSEDPIVEMLGCVFSCAFLLCFVCLFAQITSQFQSRHRVREVKLKRLRTMSFSRLSVTVESGEGAGFLRGIDNALMRGREIAWVSVFCRCYCLHYNTVDAYAPYACGFLRALDAVCCRTLPLPTLMYITLNFLPSNRACLSKRTSLFVAYVLTSNICLLLH